MGAALAQNPFRPFQVKVLKGPHAGQSFSFVAEKITIGRGSENDIKLADDLKVSRQHLEIKQSEGQFFVLNLSEKNYLLVDGEKIDSGPVPNKSILCVGESELELEIHQEEAPLSKSLVEVRPATLPPADSERTLAISVVDPHRFEIEAKAAEQKSLSPQFLQKNPPRSQEKTAPQRKSITEVRKSNPQNPVSSPQRQSFGVEAFAKESRPQSIPKNYGSAQQGGRVRFYTIVGVIGVGLYFFFSGDTKPTTEPQFRSSTEIQGDVAAAEASIKELDERISKLGDLTYRKSQENYLRGFRDFRQGNYSRARDHFQIALSLDPENELAKRYFNLSKIKFDESVKSNMIQGLRYREKKNHRMCRSSFLKVKIMIQDNKSHPDYLQATKFFEECDKALQGRY